MFLSILVTFLLAVAVHGSPKQQFRLAGLRLACDDSHVCPREDTNLISGKLNDIRYGTTGNSGNFEVVYNADGTVNFQVTAIGGHNVRYSSVVLGDGPIGNVPASCKQVGVAGTGKTHVVSFSGIQFDQCGFSQVFNGNKVHRQIVVRVRHHFTTGEVDSAGKPVDFFGYRDITVDFYLEPVTPQDTVIQPPTPLVASDLNVCFELTHNLVSQISPFPWSWHIKVTAVDYNPAIFGLGFKLDSCWVDPYLRDETRSPSHRVPFLLNGGLADDLTFDPASTVPDNLHVVSGESYEFSFAAVSHPDLKEEHLAADRRHRVGCNVCLCKIGGTGADACPTTIELIDLDSVTGGRSGAPHRKPYRLLKEDAVIESGFARQIPPRFRK